MPANSRNQSIDLVKIIAMIMVVRMHIGLAHNLPSYELSRFVHGILCPAVPLFFMVSGYLMQCRMPDYRYIWGKIGRILKFVYIVIPISCVLTGIVVHHPRPYSLVTWIIGGGNMWQFWYFAAIIIVYALAPYICKMVASSKSHIYIAIMFLICAVVTIVNVYLGFEQTYVRQTFRLYYWIFYFMLGAYIKQNGHSEHINWLWVLSMMCAAVVFITPSLTSLFDNLYGSIVCAAYAYCILCACLNTPVHDSKLISNLSSLFLPVYTLHPVAIKILANQCALNTPPRIRNAIILLTSFEFYNDSVLVNNENTIRK
ncbi:MAG: acyltransferase [Paludibacteraceae bacterium]|nr:acyltransferase [Paludibacteraceae bacterium]